METGIYQIEFFDDSVWNLYFANSTQKKNTLRNINENENLIKRFSLIVSRIHPAKQIEQVISTMADKKETKKIRKLIDVDVAKKIAKKAIDEGTNFKNLSEKVLEDYAKTIK